MLWCRFEKDGHAAYGTVEGETVTAVGDTVEIEISGIGTLRNRVVAPRPSLAPCCGPKSANGAASSPMPGSKSSRNRGSLSRSLHYSGLPPRPEVEYHAAIPATVLVRGADMELEGNLILERRPARRWITVVAVIVPVVACLAGVTWFIRAFISPPTIAIPNPMTLAAAPPAPAVRAEPPADPPPPPAQEEVRAAPSPAAAELSAAPAAATPSVFPPAPSVFPPVPSREPVTTSAAVYADPARERPAGTAAATAGAEIDAAPIAGPVPLPRPRRQAAVAIAGPVPLPRPRPADEASTSTPVQGSQPAYSRHTAE
jgi:hypothetical protein